MGPPVDREQWRRIADLLDTLLDLPAAERATFLDRACAGDPQLRAAVAAHLDADARAGDFLARPAAQAAPSLLTGLDPEEPAAAPDAPRAIGPYRLIREIGAGGMGVVYEADDTRLGRRVALKLLPSAGRRDGVTRERFLREARAAAALDHPNICTIHDVGESNGQLYLVMPLYEGATLKERLERGSLPVAEALAVAVQVARALARAHAAGIVHRDLKPANVMLTHRGEVKLLDFGIAKASGQTALTRTGGALGTPAYMAPEQLRGNPVDGRTDLWALGVLLYEMLTGRRPFSGEGDGELLAAILHRKPQPLAKLRPEAPPALARVLGKLLGKDPDERYSSADEFLAELESGTSPRRRGGLRRVAARWTMSRWGRAAGAALAVLVLAALGMDWAHRHRIARPPVRVAVLNPETTAVGSSAEIPFLAAQVVDAAIGALAAQAGVQPLDPGRRDEPSGSADEALRAREADEALRPVLTCQGDGCRVTLRRLRMPGGVVLASIGPFEIHGGIERAQQVEEAVRVHVRQLYRDRPPRAVAPGRPVRPHDYAAFARLQRRVEAGERLARADLDSLDRLLRTSPDFLGALLLAGGVARRAGELDRALDYAGRAWDLAPFDPQPLFLRFRIELAGGRFAAARSTLAELAALAPGDLRVQTSEADLLEAQGALREARRVREEIARRRPTWRHLLELATLEVRLGEGRSARRRLTALLQSEPENQYVLESLAAVEVSFGDLEKAAGLYRRLTRLRPERADLTNLGFVRYLLGDFRGAARSYREALAREPDHVLTRFNLAAALEAQGELGEARSLCRALVRDLAALPGPLAAHTRMLQAQCLARLGRRAEAAALAEEVLTQAPEDVQLLHQAAQIHALLGERLSALYYTEKALRKGLRREWFTIPELASLRHDPELSVLLDRAAPAKR